MKITGYGEFESVRKTVQKDDQSRKKADSEKSGTVSRSSDSDQVDVSSQARTYQMRDKAVEKLKQIPDPREEKVREVLEKMERGSLMTPQVVKESIASMLDRGITF